MSDIFYSFLNILNEMSPYILLGFLIAGILHVFVNEASLTRHLSGNGWKPVVKAALIGIPLPLCSCGVLPTAVSLRRQGASKAATTSFLIATPQTGVDSIAATYSLLGLAFALIRPIAALVGAMFGGMAVGIFAPDTTSEITHKPDSSSLPKLKFHQKAFESVKYGFGDMIDSMGKWLVIGLVIATLITIFVPDSMFVGLRQYPLVAMIVVVLVAVPMYICATGSIPIALSLMLKGLTPGIAFVLLMAGPAANFASIMILYRTQGKRATAVYVASVVLTAICFGLIIDYCLPARWFAVNPISGHDCCHTDLGIFETACSILLGILLIISFIRTKFLNRRQSSCHCHGECGSIENNNLKSSDMTTVYKIKGMNCAHCRAAAEKAISEVEGVESVRVDLAAGTAEVKGDVPAEKIINAVHLAGFEASIL